MAPRMTRTISVIGVVAIALTIVVGMYLLVSEKHWFVLAMGLWAALSATVIVHDHRRAIEDDPEDDAAGNF